VLRISSPSGELVVSGNLASQRQNLPSTSLADSFFHFAFFAAKESEKQNFPAKIMQVSEIKKGQTLLSLPS